MTGSNNIQQHVQVHVSDVGEAAQERAVLLLSSFSRESALVKSMKFNTEQTT